MDFPDTFARAMYRFRKDKVQFQDLLDYTKIFGLDERTIMRRYNMYKIRESLRWVKHFLKKM